MANFKDFAVGLVGTTGAPSPATTGTSITLRAGDGVSMPTPPFYVTATPPGQLTTLGTSEKLLVTAVSTDTLTVVRAQDGTSAKSIASGWIIANAIYAADVTSSSMKLDELMTGTVNGVNKDFTTASSFSSIIVYRNGVTLHVGDDYTITGTNKITMLTAPPTGTKLVATYIVGSQVMISGSNSMIFDETPSGTVNGSTTLFTVSRAYVPGSLQVFINGIKQKRGTHFTETSPTSGTFTMGDAPLTGDDIMITYQFVVAVSGNADTVDGYHANATPTANQIPVLDSNGRMPAAATYVGSATQSAIGAFETTSSTTFTDLATVGPSVTINVPPSGIVMISISLIGWQNTVGGFISSSVAMSGANTATALSQPGYNWIQHKYGNDGETTSSRTFLLTGLNPGSTTFKMQYSVSSGTGNIGNRLIVVVPL